MALPTCLTRFFELPTLKIPTVCKPEWGGNYEELGSIYYLEFVGTSCIGVQGGGMRTILLKVLAAAVQHTGHLPVDWVQAQPLVLLLLLLASWFRRK